MGALTRAAGFASEPEDWPTVNWSGWGRRA